MRHKKQNKRLGRNRSQRKQLLRSVVRGLFLSYKIETTLAKAKETRKLADSIIRYAKSGTLQDIRAMESILQDRALVSSIIKVLVPLSKDRKGGYTRITKIQCRRGDGAEMAVLELTDLPVKEEKKKRLKRQKSAATDTKITAKPEVDKTDKDKKEVQVKDKTKIETSQPEGKKPEKAQKPKADKPIAKTEDSASKTLIDKKPEKEIHKPDKKGLLMGRFKGFFRKGNK